MRGWFLHDGLVAAATVLNRMRQHLAHGGRPEELDWLVEDLYGLHRAAVEEEENEEEVSPMARLVAEVTMTAAAATTSFGPPPASSTPFRHSSSSRRNNRSRMRADGASHGPDGHGHGGDGYFEGHQGHGGNFEMRLMPPSAFLSAMEEEEEEN